MITAEQFAVLQQYLIGAYWPFILFALIAFVVLGVMTAIGILFLRVSRELLAPFT